MFDRTEPVLILGYHFFTLTRRSKFCYLYLIINIYSRMIVAWEIHQNESAEHASQMITRACHGIAAMERLQVLYSEMVVQ